MDDMSVLEYLTMISAVVGVLSIVATFTPTPVDDGVLAILRKVLNVLAANWGESENLKKPGTAGKKKSSTD